MNIITEDSLTNRDLDALRWTGNLGECAAREIVYLREKLRQIETLIPMLIGGFGQRPLTEDQIWRDDDLMSRNGEVGASMPVLMRLIRAVERAHGIGDEQ